MSTKTPDGVEKKGRRAWKIHERPKWMVAFLLLATPISVAPHAPGKTGTGYSFPADIFVTGRPQRRNEYPVPVFPWTCWYEGARIHRVPVASGEAALRAAEVGQTFSTGVVQENPFGDEWIRISPNSSEGPLWIPLAYCRRVAPENDTDGDLPIGSEQIGPYDGLPLDYQPSDLTPVPARYCYNDLPQRLRPEALEACIEMIDAARREAGLRIKVLSTFRSAHNQAYLCGRKIAEAGIDQGDVARPGHSEHQLGTAIDFVRDDGRRLLEPDFGDAPEGRWLRANCRRFGFVMTYTVERAAREGVAVEPWHFRYVGRENAGRFETRLREGTW